MKTDASRTPRYVIGAATAVLSKVLNCVYNIYNVLFFRFESFGFSKNRIKTDRHFKTHVSRQCYCTHALRRRVILHDIIVLLKRPISRGHARGTLVTTTSFHRVLILAPLRPSSVRTRQTVCVVITRHDDIRSGDSCAGGNGVGEIKRRVFASRYYLPTYEVFFSDRLLAASNRFRSVVCDYESSANNRDRNTRSVFRNTQ